MAANFKRVVSEYFIKGKINFLLLCVILHHRMHILSCCKSESYHKCKNADISKDGHQYYLKLQ